MSFSVCRVKWDEAAPLLKELREIVFVCEWRIPKKIEFDQYDKDAFHMIVCDDNTQEPVATGRILSNGEISRIAVLKPYRQYQLDKIILSGLLNTAKDIGLNDIYINSPLTKVEHYCNNNFSAVSRVYMKAGFAWQRLTCSLDNITTFKSYLAH